MYDEIKAEIDRLTKERGNCVSLKSALGDISSELTGIKYSLNLSASTLSLGAFSIDGKAIDVYSFGGFKKYASEKVDPLISALGGISSQIDLLVIEYDNAITILNERLDELDDTTEETDEETGKIGIDKTKLKPIKPIKVKRSPRLLTQ